MDEPTHTHTPVTEVQKAAALVWVLILKAEVGPAAQAVVPHAQAQLLGHRRLCGLPTWTTAGHRNRDGGTVSGVAMGKALTVLALSGVN